MPYSLKFWKDLASLNWHGGPRQTGHGRTSYTGPSQAGSPHSPMSGTPNAAWKSSASIKGTSSCRCPRSGLGAHHGRSFYLFVLTGAQRHDQAFALESMRNMPDCTRAWPLCMKTRSKTLGRVLLGGRSAVLCKTMLSCAHGCSYKRLIQREHAPRGAFVSLDVGRLQAGIDQKGPAIARTGQVTVELKSTCSSPARSPRRSTSKFTDLKLHMIFDRRRGCHGPSGHLGVLPALNIVLRRRS